MAPWNSFPLQVIYQILGWLAFLSWSVAVYPQIILNFRRKRFLFFFLHVLSSFKFFFFFLCFLITHKCFWFCLVNGFSVMGLSLDYTILNFTKHWSYLIYNASLFFSPVVQKQYFDKYGYGQVCMHHECSLILHYSFDFDATMHKLLHYDSMV